MGREAQALDTVRYQTVYADGQRARSVAAPTAGLHFTPELLEALAARGVGRATLTLDVGPGTFLPVRAQAIDAHVMHEERFSIPPETAARIDATRGQGRGGGGGAPRWCARWSRRSFPASGGCRQAPARRACSCGRAPRSTCPTR
jgi:hypothetical protein